nr:leucine-rich repeat domain-containing protein [Candidatus Sigynarchaeota archaeon]
MSELPPGIEDPYDDRLIVVQGQAVGGATEYTEICIVYERQYRILNDNGFTGIYFGPYPNGHHYILVYNGHVVKMVLAGDIPIDIDFTQFPFLISLEFESCKLKRIPPSIAKIPHLQEFKFYKNNIEVEEGEPIEIKCSQAKIDLSYNNLKKIPFIYLHRECIKEIYLQGNRLQEVPELVFNSPNLEKLFIGENEIRDFPARVKELTSLKELNLSRWPLPNLPDNLRHLPNLECFNCTPGELQHLPDWLPEWRHLKKLIIVSNRQLQSIPESIGALETLELLHIDRNKLHELPSSLNRCKNLQDLDVGYNELGAITDWIHGLTQLRILTLWYNKIAAISDAIGTLTNLKELHLNENKIQELPSSIGNLQQLTYIDLSSNPLKQLPYGFADLPETLSFSIPGKIFPLILEELLRSLAFRESKIKYKKMKVIKLYLKAEKRVLDELDKLNAAQSGSEKRRINAIKRIKNVAAARREVSVKELASIVGMTAMEVETLVLDLDVAGVVEAEIKEGTVIFKTSA